MKWIEIFDEGSSSDYISDSEDSRGLMNVTKPSQKYFGHLAMLFDTRIFVNSLSYELLINDF